MYSSKTGGLLTMPKNSELITKSLTRRLVKMVGGVQPAAIICSTSGAMISKYCNPDHPQVINSRSIVALTRQTQDASLINHIVKECGLEAEIKKQSDAFEMMMKLAKVNKEGSDFTAVTVAALADLKISTTEARLMLKEALELQAAISDIIKDISTTRGVETAETTEPPQ
jgi:Phage regulatory protein CII (CP76)